MEIQDESIKHFSELYAWQEAHELVVMIYRITKEFPKEEAFGLTNQMRRSAVSITSNIAEGFSRRTSKEKCQFYYISKGSTTELQDQLYIARDVGYLNQDIFKECMEKSIKVHKLINSLISSCKKYFK